LGQRAVATTISANTGTPIDFASLKIANDATNVYFLITYNTAVNPQSGSGVFTAIDSDNNGATGYNIFGNAAIGSNFGFQNDFPFTQAAGNFNSGGTVVGASSALRRTRQHDVPGDRRAVERDAGRCQHRRLHRADFNRHLGSNFIRPTARATRSARLPIHWRPSPSR